VCTFPIQNGLKLDASSSLPFNFVLEHATVMVSESQDRLKMNGTHQLPVYADDVTVLGKNILCRQDQNLY
jgi:hypothetical protein